MAEILGISPPAVSFSPAGWVMGMGQISKPTVADKACHANGQSSCKTSIILLQKKACYVAMSLSAALKLAFRTWASNAILLRKTTHVQKK